MTCFLKSFLFFFYNVVNNNSELRVANNDKRYIEWQDEAEHPEVLGLENLPGIRESDAWFVRKVDDNHCPQLMDRLDELIHDNAFDNI